MLRGSLRRTWHPTYAMAVPTGEDPEKTEGIVTNRGFAGGLGSDARRVQLA
jgi:hypothetical protein